jgi:lipopolysaccharide export LptBFGC system permease protein LptF
MKLLDRYLFSIFGNAFILVTLTFITLFTAMDLSSRIARILSLKNVNTLSFLGYYYLIRLPTFLHHVLPAVSLFAAMFTVIQLQKTNELLPMITSGVSLRRLSLIFVAGALACSLAMAVLDEFVLPPLMDEIGRTDDVLISDRPQRNQMFPIDEGFWNIDELAAGKNRLTGVMITEFRPDGRRKRVIRAGTGEWDYKEKNWILRDGYVTPFNESGTPVMVPGTRTPVEQRFPPEGFRMDPPPTPENLQRRFSISGRSYRFSELRELRSRYRHTPAYEVHMHLKFASPLGPLVLLFLGLPFVSGAHHRSFYRGIGLCLLLTVSYYAVTFVCFEMAGKGLSPAVAVWGPIGLFGIAGLISFLRMRS